MKPQILALVAVLPLMASVSTAAPALSLGSGSGAPGATVDLPLTFNAGGAAVTAMQFDLTLPPSLSTVSFTAGSIITTADKSITARLSGNTWSFIIFGLNQTVLGSGTLLTARVRIAAGAAGGSLAVGVQTPTFSDAGGHTVAGSATGGSVTVTGGGTTNPPIPGPLPVLSLSALDGRTFRVDEEISVSYSAPVPVQYDWLLEPVAGGAGSASTTLAAPTSINARTSAPKFTPASSGASAGSYRVTLTVREIANTSNMRSASASMTLISATGNALSGVQIYPNPWKKGEHNGGVHFAGLPGGTRIKIFTLSGYLVRDAKTDLADWEWDLRNDKGDSVASGLYLYRLSSGGSNRRGRLALIR